jgi:hypothetical protein
VFNDGARRTVGNKEKKVQNSIEVRKSFIGWLMKKNEMG